MGWDGSSRKKWDLVDQPLEFWLTAQHWMVHRKSISIWPANCWTKVTKVQTIARLQLVQRRALSHRQKQTWNHLRTPDVHRFPSLPMSANIFLTWFPWVSFQDFCKVHHRPKSHIEHVELWESWLVLRGEWANDMILDSYYGSLTHSLRLAPVMR
jgi:hypothetical protein